MHIVLCSLRAAVKSRNCRSSKFKNLPGNKLLVHFNSWLRIKIKCVAVRLWRKIKWLVTLFSRLDVSQLLGLVHARCTSKTCWTFSFRISIKMVRLFCQMYSRKFWALTPNSKQYQATWQKNWSYLGRTLWLATKESYTQSTKKMTLEKQLERSPLISSSNTLASWTAKSFL